MNTVLHSYSPTAEWQGVYAGDMFITEKQIWRFGSLLLLIYVFILLLRYAVHVHTHTHFS